MKVCLGQINTTPGDFKGNLERVKKGIDIASAQNCDLIVFPELTLTGYLSQDLLYNPEYIEASLSTLEEIKRVSLVSNPMLHIVLGYVAMNPGPGKPYVNAAAVINQGQLISEYRKQLLPSYDVFDEVRYFEPGFEPACFSIKNSKIGIAVCEDLWNDKNSDDYNYKKNPALQYRDLGVDLLVSLNSSPYVQGKREQRFKKILDISKSGLDIVYVNQIGGQDELVFDGNSFVVQGGKVVLVAEEIFRDSYPIFDFQESGMESLGSKDPVDSFHELKDLLILGMKDYVEKSGFDQVVLASSGGVDSALVCMLACEALGSENVHAVRMPSIFSSEHSREDAIQLHQNLGCWDYEIPIVHESIVADLNERYAIHSNPLNLVYKKNSEKKYNPVADENMQARLRDIYIMHFSNAYRAMPLSTGNKTESACGYYTHFDMNFSFAPIKDLYKHQVFRLARSDARIPSNIWTKPPSAELAANQLDEESLLPYSILDPIVMAYVEGSISSFLLFRSWCLANGHVEISSDKIALQSWLESAVASDQYSSLVSLIGKMEYKRRQTCPGTKVSKVAFGIGRRIPIVEKWS